MPPRYILIVLDARGIVALALSQGERLDLSACDYGDGGARRGFLSGPRAYYAFLAGLAQSIRAERIVEVGTHHGGSARALASGQEAAGRAPAIVTFDPDPMSAAGIAGVPGIRYVEGDARSPQAAELTAHWLGDRPLDLLYVDALKDDAFVADVLERFAALQARWVVLDDINANDAMRFAWQQTAGPHGPRAVRLEDVSLTAREPPYGQGVVATSPNSLAMADTGAARDVALQGWRLDGTLPRVAPPPVRTVASRSELELLHALASRLHGWGEVVETGALLAGTTGVLADGLAANGRRVHAYDHFLNLRHRRLVPDVERGASVYRIAAEAVASHGQRVVLHQGDLRDVRWIGRPIELLVHDAGDDITTEAAVLEVFGPWWIPGRTIVVLLGVLEPRAWWRHLALAELLDAGAVPVAVRGATIAVGVLEVAPPVTKRAERWRASSSEDRIAATHRVTEGVDHPDVSAAMALAEAWIFHESNPQQARDAARVGAGSASRLVRKWAGRLARAVGESDA